MKKKLPIQLLQIACVVLLPLFFVFNSSLKSESDFLRDSVGLVQKVHLTNYLDAFVKAKFGLYAINSLFYATVCVSVSIVLAVLLAFPIARGFFRFGRIIYTAFLLGMFLPSGAIPLWQMFLKAGLYNTRAGYMLTMIGGGGVTLFFFVTYIKNLPKEFDEAASIDGAGRWRQLFSITIPGILPTIIVMFILRVGNIMNVGFEKIILLYNPINYESSDVIASFVYRKGLIDFQWSYAAAVGLFNSVINLTLLLAANRTSRKITNSSLW